MLSISNLHVSVGDKPILKRLSREVPADEGLAIVGANEAGALAMCYVDWRRMP